MDRIKNIYKNKWFRIFGPVLLIVILLVISANIYVGRSNRQRVNNSDSNILINKSDNNDLDDKSINSITKDWETYTNSKYGYSFKYPNTAKLTSSTEYGGDKDIDPTSPTTNVSIERAIDHIFSITNPGIELTPQDIKRQFGAGSSKYVSVIPLKISEHDAYKVVISGDNSVISNFYFVKNASGLVLEITVVKDSDIAQNIFSSFSLIMKEVGDPKINPSASASINDSGWKTFTNRSGWSIEYPGDWKLSSCSACTDLTDPENFINFWDEKSGLITVSPEANTLRGKDAEQWFSSIKNSIIINNIIVDEKRTTVDGLAALKIEQRDASGGAYSGATYIYAQPNSYTISLSYTSGEDGVRIKDLSYYSTYNKMVSSFRLNR